MKTPNATADQPRKMPTPEELEAMMVVPAVLVTSGVFVLQLLIYGLPIVAIALPLLYSPALGFTVVWLLCAPLLYAFLFATIAGVLSIPFQAGIVKGLFPRDKRFPVFAMRKLYNMCWQSLYYFKPIYTIILNVPFFKAITFRLFGYKGSLNINLFPDTWIRDLPLLRIEEGVYIANRATLGTNVGLTNGFTIVGNITLKKNSLIGHLTKVGMGVTLGERSEFGIGCTIGLHAKFGNDVQIGGACGISHGAKIGNNTQIGVRSFVGTGAIIGDNLNIPSNTQIPDGAVVNTMEDVMKYVQLSPATPVAKVHHPTME